jgi:hypothetical protein
MPYSEYHSCDFELCLYGHSNVPSHLNIDALSGGQSLVQKGIDRVSLTFKKGTTIPEAEELEQAMTRHLKALRIVYLQRQPDG